MSAFRRFSACILLLLAASAGLAAGERNLRVAVLDNSPPMAFRDASGELSGFSLGIAPRRPELKEQIDAALERIKRNGTYDRINSQFLPFRVN